MSDSKTSRASGPIVGRLPSSASAPGGWWRLSYRAPALIVMLLIGALSVLWLRFDQLCQHRFQRYTGYWIRGWIRTTVRVLGVRLTITGQQPASPSLIVSNHVSWLDALLVGGAIKCRFLVKYEVGTWPIIGLILKGAGSLFIGRGANQTARVNNELAAALMAGSHVVIYPEATTSWGDELLYFFPRLFKAAKLANVAVQPVAVAYQTLRYRGEEYRSCAPYTDDMQFVQNMVGLLKAPYTEVEMRYLTPLSSASLSRDELANSARRSLAQSLALQASQRQRDDIDFPALVARLRRVPGSWKRSYDS